MRRSLAAFLVVAVVAVGFVMVPAPQRAEAWKPPTHLFGVEDALADAVADGVVSIPRADGGPATSVPVNATIKQALVACPECYRAGAIGPDAFPDLLFGQGQIHPDTRTENDTLTTPRTTKAAQTFEWFQHLWDGAWSSTGPERLRNIAFALGYMGGHGNGDVWAHTYVNELAEGVFPSLGEFEHHDISVRHVVVEGYIDKHRPGFEEHHTYAIDAPDAFVADSLIFSDFARTHGSSPIYDFFFGIRDGLVPVKADLHQDNTTQDILGECPLCVPDPTDSPLNLVEWGIDLLLEQYIENWIEDIDDGLRAWVGVWETIARELFTGKSPDTAVIMEQFKQWALLHFLSMMGLPDFVGTGIYLIGEVVSFITGLITSALSAVWSALESLPVVGPVFVKIREFYDDTRADITAKITEIADDLAGIFLTFALGFTELPENVKKAFDKNNDGKINPSEVIRVFQEPEEYITDTNLFPAGTRAKVDAAMGLPAGTDKDDAPENFRDYDPDKFAALYDTRVMARLAMLDEVGLNEFFRQRAGGNAGALNGLYPTSGGAAPQNIMLGWAKSIDAEYQWRERSVRDNRSYGTGQMRMFEDCVSRRRVFATTFKEPVPGGAGFDDHKGQPYQDLPTGITDSQAPLTTASLSGPSITNSGQTFVSGTTDISLTATDNYFANNELKVYERHYDSASAAPGYTEFTGNPPPFRLTGTDGTKVVEFYAVDDAGRCNTESKRRQEYSLDNTPPVITVTSPLPQDYLSDVDPLLLSFTADDGPGSGVDPTSYRHMVDGVVQAGPPGVVDVFDYPAGPHTYRAEAKDNLGNPGSKEVVWTTIVSHSSLQNNLATAFGERSCIANLSTYHSLQVKLQNAEAADARGNDGASDNQLEAFKNEVAQRTGTATEPGKTITPYCSNILVTNANALQAA